MLPEKKQLSAAQIEAQAAFELPDREMMALVNVVLLNGVDIAVPVTAAANICDVDVNVLAEATQQGDVTCTARSGDFSIEQ